MKRVWEAIVKQLAFAIGLVTVSFYVAAPALADFAVIQFRSGYCRIWTDTAAGPQDGQFVLFRVHHHQFDRFHTREQADAALHWAVQRQVCRHWW
jgi:hypothetical protein